MDTAVNKLHQRSEKAGLKSAKTFCQICSAFCGIEIVSDGKKVVRVLPDKQNAFNWGDYCAKAAYAGTVRDHPKRLRSPMRSAPISAIRAAPMSDVVELNAAGL